MTDDIVARLVRRVEELRKYQRIAADLSDKFHGTPCAEIRWQQELDAALARAEAAERERDEAKADAEEWRDKYNDEHKTADELSIKLEGARTDWSLQSKISNGYAGALIIAEKARDAALARAEAAEAKVAELAKEVAEWRSRPDALRADKAEAKVAKLREALYPFTAPSSHYYEDFKDHETLRVQLPAGWVRRARAALQETSDVD